MIPFFLLVISSITRLAYFGYPGEVVFDEVHYGNFISNYWHGTFYFDVHPPLANLLYYLSSIFSGFIADVNFGAIGNTLPESFVILRLVPLIAGILLPIIVYMICRRLEVSKLSSTVIGLLLCFENSLIVQSRFVLPDIILTFFGFLSLLLYFEYRHEQYSSKTRFIFCLMAIISAGAALSVKWTGSSFLLLIMLLEAYYIFSDVGQIRTKIRKINSFIMKCIGLVALFYFAVFIIHFSLTPKSGPGNAFMSPQFQKSLDGNSYVNDEKVSSEWGVVKFVELNEKIIENNAHFTATHSYGSKWYTWPLMSRPVFYWQSSGATDGVGGEKSYIYYLGNPIIYWLGTIVISCLIFYACWYFFRRRWRDIDSLFRQQIFFVLAGFLVNFLPFVFIGRVMFLYHYEAALIFSVIAIGIFLEMVQTRRRKIIIASCITAIVVIVFQFFAPLTYGTPLRDNELQSRMWLSSWR